MKLCTISVCMVLFIAKILSAQDLIVKTNGDSIKCRIVKVSGSSIHFAVKENGDEIETYLFKSQIYQYRSGINDVIVLNDINAGNTGVKYHYMRVRIAIQGGFSYMVANVNENVPYNLVSHVEKLKSGYHFGADLGFFPLRNFGLGVKYNVFNSNAESHVPADVRDYLKIQYVGPSLLGRFTSQEQKTSLILQLSGGYITYLDNSFYNTSSSIVEGNTAGLHFGLGVDTRLVQNLYFGIGLGYTSAAMDHFTVYENGTTHSITLSEDNKENISRFDASVGLRFYFF